MKFLLRGCLGHLLLVCVFVSNVLCPPSCLSLQLNVSELFRNLDLQLLQPMSLTLMHSSTPLANDSTVSLDPMELSTFKLKLR